MTIDVLVTNADIELSPADFYNRYLAPAMVQAKLKLHQFPSEPITLEVHLNGSI